MPKANIKKLIPVLFFFVILSISGCSNPEAKKTKSLEKIDRLLAADDSAAALAKLDLLSGKYPEDSEILQKIGSIHQQLGNTAEAAFYLNAAFSLAPKNQELHYQNYRAQEAANQPAAAYILLEKLAANHPAVMSGELWLRLGEFHAQAEKTQPALDAYMKGIVSTETLDSGTVLAIGTLYKQLDDRPQAERWLTIAANSKEPNALLALFGLLEIHLLNENHDAVEKTVSQLDNQFPGAIDASEWSDIHDRIAGLSKEPIKIEEPLPELAKVKAVDKPTDPIADAIGVATIPSGKAQISVDVANAGAFATKPAKEEKEEKTPLNTIRKKEQRVRRIASDPDIVVKPADPKPDFFDALNNQEDQLYNAIPSSDLQDSNYNSDSPDPTKSADAELDLPSSANLPTVNQIAPTPQMLDNLLAKAEAATSAGNYENAIRLYQEALAIANERADLWNAVANVYSTDGQTKNAVAAALKATRLDPFNVEYTLDYLRLIQRTQNTADFINELETAYSRFPDNPEIILSLARAYQRIDKHVNAARMLYKRFIELAPDHPLRPEAEAALKEIS